jgi:hypothetical protein
MSLLLQSALKFKITGQRIKWLLAIANDRVIIRSRHPLLVHVVGRDRVLRRDLNRNNSPLVVMNRNT